VQLAPSQSDEWPKDDTGSAHSRKAVIVPSDLSLEHFRPDLHVDVIKISPSDTGICDVLLLLRLSSVETEHKIAPSKGQLKVTGDVAVMLSPSNGRHRSYATPRKSVEGGSPTRGSPEKVIGDTMVTSGERSNREKALDTGGWLQPPQCPNRSTKQI